MLTQGLHFNIGHACLRRLRVVLVSEQFRSDDEQFIWMVKYRGNTVFNQTYRYAIEEEDITFLRLANEAVAAVAVIRRRRRKCGQRRMWVRCIFLESPMFGAFHRFMPTMRSYNKVYFKRFLRFPQRLFYTLLEKIKPLLWRPGTNYRQSVSPAHRLTMTFHYLAYGGTIRRLEFEFLASECTIGKAIPQVCDAIYAVLKDTQLKVHWAPSSEIFFVRADEACGPDPIMRMEAVSLGDEVRFATTPDVITIDKNSVPTNNNYHPDYLRTQTPRERKLRVQVAMNKQGHIELNLSNLDLRVIPPETFNFTRIELLNVSKNKLSVVPSAIAHLRKLRTFDAHHNHIQSLPDTLGNCSHLQEVDLSNNRLTSLPVQFGVLRHLRILKLGNNQFESIPHEIGSLESLRQLDLPGNKLWHLPGTVATLHNLHLLNLGHNVFEQLPIAVCQLRQIEAVDLRDNQLLNLPPDCEQWHHLKEFNVSSNRLETVPHCISNLRNLHSLDLSHNKIKVMPPRLARLTKLRVLMACDNQITLVPNNLESLEYLNLAENRLKNFSVSKMRRLKYLNVNHNMLENLPLGVCNLPHLEVLKLNTNRISYVSQDVILLKYLRTLDLGHNKLTSLPHVINEMDSLETFNIQGNQLDPRYSHPHRDMAYLQQAYTMYPAQVGRQDHHRMHADVHKKNNMQKTFDKKKRKHTLAGAPKKKNRSTQYEPHSRVTDTQYTPKSNVNVRERPPLDYVPPSNSLPPSYPHSKKSAWSERAEKIEREAEIPGNSAPHNVTEISYPLESMASNKTVPHHRKKTHHSTTEKSAAEKSTKVKSTRESRSRTAVSEGNVSMYTKSWLEGRKNLAGHSIRSNAATVNDSVGDELSLGDDDYDFQPTTVRDDRLLDVCKEVEALLNTQMLQPWVQPKSIFKKSLNERGTMRMLNGLRNEQEKQQTRTYEVNPDPEPKTLLTSNTREMTPGHLLDDSGGNILLRTKADQFDVTPAGGLYKSSMDPNITVYFPVKAINEPLTITMQLEKVDQEALLAAKRTDPIVNNVLAMGHVVHVTQSDNVDFNEQVTLTIPAPPAPKRGKVHILTYNDDNTCSPCGSPYKVYHGYISLQVWHCSGKGAVLTKSKCKYKACKSVEQLLSKLYV